MRKMARLLRKYYLPVPTPSFLPAFRKLSFKMIKFTLD